MTRDDFAAVILPVLIERGQGVANSGPEQQRAICQGAWRWADMMLDTRNPDGDDTSFNDFIQNPVIG